MSITIIVAEPRTTQSCVMATVSQLCHYRNCGWNNKQILVSFCRLWLLKIISCASDILLTTRKPF